MKRNTLKLLGLGVLTSALITGGFEIFARGNMPVKGITVGSILNGDQEKIKDQEKTINELLEENSSLNEENNDLAESVESYKKTQEANEKKIKSLDKEVSALKLEYIGEEETQESDHENSEESSDNANSSSSTDSTKGTFTISNGETSSDIASRLQSEGYIDSAQDFQNLIDTWQLQQYIQSNSYEISSDMSMDEILSIITNGVYYY